MPASAAETAVSAAFGEQARWCRSLGSPLTALVCEIMAEEEWPDGEVARRLRGWPGDPRPSADAVPLRLCGGLHAMVRAGSAPDLAACYPPHPLPERAVVADALAKIVRTDDLAVWLDRPPQTNEVGRANALFAGVLAFTSRFSVPLALFELGASAGLNLNMDRFAYDLGGALVGDPDSPLKLHPEWHGPPPPAPLVDIRERRGVDLTPLDASRDGDRLLAFVWPDQAQRIAQLAAALEVARRHPLQVDRGDAGAWLEARLAEPQLRGTGRLIYHSIAFQYFPPATQEQVRAAIGRAGEGARPETPVGWLRFERTPDDQDPTLRLLSWPGSDDRLLATCHPHGTAINWLDDAPAR